MTPSGVNVEPAADTAAVEHRDGPFTARWYAGERGALALRIPGPDGEFFDAVASMEYRCPPWVSDPFTAPDARPGGGHGGESAGGEGPGGDVLGGRYRVTRGIYQAAHGNVFRAVDTETRRPVVVKQARAHVGEGKDGSDARTRLRNERRVLEAADGVEGVPALVDHFAHGADEFLATSDAGSTNLLLHVRLHGSFMPPAHTPGWAPPFAFLRLMTEVAATLEALHARGIVMRDVTPRNIVLGAERAVLIDFGLAAWNGFHLPGGTPGFAPARQLRGGTPRPEDDCFALGMVLGYAATGMLPLAGVTVPGLARTRMLQAVTALYGEEQRDFARLLGALLSDEPGAARGALGALAARGWFGREGAPRTAPPVGGGAVRVEPATLARHVLDSVISGVEADLLAAPGASIGAVDASVYTGSAGIGLELLHHRDHKDVPALLPRLASHAVTAAHRVDLAPGLLAGATGVHVFLAALRAEGVAWAEETPGHEERQGHGGTEGCGGTEGRGAYGLAFARQGAAPDASDDILSGTAGIGLGHLFLGDLEEGATGAAHLDAARACADELLARDEPRMSVTPDSGLPQGAGVDPSFGYAHGLAGVVDFLLALAARDGEGADPRVVHGAHTRALALCARAGDLVAASGAASAVPITASWCQGLAGAARTLHHAGRLFGDPAFTGAALSAAAACAAWVPRMENLSQCCGVAGAGSALAEIAHDTGDERCWDGAHRAARHLVARSFDPDEAPLLIAPGAQDAPHSWGMGTTGLLAFLRRLTRPHTPDLLTRTV
ncbi:lanthionine synthetase LanC family protein [Streptomyces iconiensis]|uniref:non-specific serine/threonine protein kinase n=1 Tax=Streptomyces iconiensis TaxID=1384038 RepID=A0ABT7AAL1_9ACTN|nr:lanthionine synthetase LanC family protein [Streptomyces iconiensis]MDJ1138393.1 lanthionine synthetase LanC family protein [Streptomyces iconiensis]